ncbi:hypothetical protein AMTRI_Chr06g177830 [Amborella trichopoda]
MVYFCVLTIFRTNFHCFGSLFVFHLDLLLFFQWCHYWCYHFNDIMCSPPAFLLKLQIVLQIAFMNILHYNFVLPYQLVHMFLHLNIKGSKSRPRIPNCCNSI